MSSGTYACGVGCHVGGGRDGAGGMFGLGLSPVSNDACLVTATRVRGQKVNDTSTNSNNGQADGTLIQRPVILLTSCVYSIILLFLLLPQLRQP